MLTAIGSAVLAATTILTVMPATSSAEPALHHVRYTVTSEQPFFADIYYREVDPPDFAAYSHNPYQYSPLARAEVGPDRPWVLDVMLADPYFWAMVTATSGVSPQTPMFHCTLEVDGAVVATDEGPKGALCSIRSW